tara:strand:+ start:2909 stop:3316 length:408 start_codon:yes stop_codon:yes gene_type:complete
MSIFRVLAKAAGGDKEAQTAMANYALRLVDDPDTDKVMALMEGSIFARLALVNGGDDERTLLVTILSSLGTALQDKEEFELADSIFAEVVAHLDILADSPGSEADQFFPLICSNTRPEILKEAQIFKQFWREEHV